MLKQYYYVLNISVDELAVAWCCMVVAVVVSHLC